MRPIEWLGDQLKLLDQTELPHKEKYLETADYRQVIGAIKQLKVRGAPAIGVATAYGIALAGLEIKAANKTSYIKQLELILKQFATARPTAVNLFYAINRMRQAANNKDTVVSIRKALVKAAVAVHREEDCAMAALSKHGSELIADGLTVLTHCNTGQLATGVRYGTALGVIKAAAEQGKRITVYADETRPLLQGSRLTAWELSRLHIPFILITDNMAGYFLSLSKIDCVIVGADRIAANGDTANKIGTYSLAVLAKVNRVPFYIAAPTSSIDISLKSGASIPIEQRSPLEVLKLNGANIAPSGSYAANPAFDVTPARYIAAIITEKGIIRPPFKTSIQSILQEAR
ncbi:MAG: S-methyl-5-thioribose-1-phosphate isomerase [Dehalococcoidia bacterium]|jgi:methylthioribose-1-phosphate isomerase